MQGLENDDPCNNIKTTHHLGDLPDLDWIEQGSLFHLFVDWLINIQAHLSKRVRFSCDTLSQAWMWGQAMLSDKSCTMPSNFAVTQELPVHRYSPTMRKIATHLWASNKHPAPDSVPIDTDHTGNTGKALSGIVAAMLQHKARNGQSAHVLHLERVNKTFTATAWLCPFWYAYQNRLSKVSCLCQQQMLRRTGVSKVRCKVPGAQSLHESGGPNPTIHGTSSCRACLVLQGRRPFMNSSKLCFSLVCV